MEKIILFFIISLLLGFIITYFYNKKINKDFFLTFIIISSILFIIFYYLAQTNEYYSNYLNDINNSINTSNSANFYNDNIINTNYIIRDNLDSEINDYIIDNIKSNKKNPIESEEPYPEIKTQEEANFIQDNINQLTDFVSNNLLRPDFTNYFMKTPIPTQVSTTPSSTPINININYGGNDPINSDNKKKEDDKPKNLGNANCSRIYNNSDWIYGDNAWTTKPDYYVPDCSESKYTNCNNCDSCKDCCQCNKNNKNTKNTKNNNIKPLNESIPTKTCKNDVAPIMVNVPWTNYQSGDMDPEPYNL
jgi:hypothetical protein